MIMNDMQTQAGNVSAQNSQSGSQVTQNEGRQDNRALMPRVDVVEDASGLTLWADLPGVSKDQLELKVEGDTLTVEGSIAAWTPDKLEPLYAEVRLPRYRRAFTLSRELDPSKIEANLKDGVLQLRIPKQEHAQPRRIEVRAG
jgi:HSP20 family protein